jgi:hypothetical protein
VSSMMRGLAVGYIVLHPRENFMSCCSSVVERGIAVSAIILRSVVRPSVAAFLLLGKSNLFARAPGSSMPLQRCILREADDLTLG